MFTTSATGIGPPRRLGEDCWETVAADGAEQGVVDLYRESGLEHPRVRRCHRWMPVRRDGRDSDAGVGEHLLELSGLPIREHLRQQGGPVIVAVG